MNAQGIRSAIVLAIGVALAGWLVGRGFEKGRTADRWVTVKGLSEREVASDAVFWPLRYVATNDDLSAAQSTIEGSRRKVLEFLAEYGIPADAVEVQNLEVTDVLANPYGNRDGGGGGRYIIAQTLMVGTDDVDAVRGASQAVGDLVDAGVVLGGNWQGPTYLFRGLNDLKPEMIAEATASAREAAEKFAADSGARLGGIRRANQGVFQILPRDRVPGISQESQPWKIVRVVSTIDYLLE
jgi:hypothetical protein